MPSSEEEKRRKSAIETIGKTMAYRLACAGEKQLMRASALYSVARAYTLPVLAPVVAHRVISNVAATSYRRKAS